MVEVEAAAMSTDPSQFFGRPAVFVSTYAPGYVAGAAQCTLAYWQALAKLHRGQISYVGPPSPAIAEAASSGQSIGVGPRTWWQKASGLLRLRHIDRTTPAAEALLRTIDDRRTVVYVNGEYAGAVVRTAKQLGLTAVFLPHNFPTAYLDAERHSRNPVHVLYRKIAVKNALVGYKHADLCLFLTEHDAESYHRASGASEVRARDLSGMYFGYAQLPAISPQPSHGHPFTVLVSTNMGSRQNEEGVLRFLAEVWSRVPTDRKWQLVLAGGYPGPSIHQAAERLQAVSIVEAPEPDEMEQVFGRCSICAATSLQGSGIKLRVGEALRRGLPVLSSPHCAIGYENVSPEVLRVFHSANQALSHLRELAGEDLQKLKPKCAAEYDREFSFDAGLQKMGRIAEFFN